MVTLGFTALLLILTIFFGYTLLVLNSDRGVALNSVILQRIPQEDASSWGTLEAGISFSILGEQNGFFLIETAFQKKGWVRRQEVGQYSPTWRSAADE